MRASECSLQTKIVVEFNDLVDVGNLFAFNAMENLFILMFKLDYVD